MGRGVGLDPGDGSAEPHPARRPRPAGAQGRRRREPLRVHDESVSADPATTLLRDPEMTPGARRPMACSKKARGRRAQERGVALIMVLGAIAVMVVMLAEFQDDA